MGEVSIRACGERGTVVGVVFFGVFVSVGGIRPTVIVVTASL